VRRLDLHERHERQVAVDDDRVAFIAERGAPTPHAARQRRAQFLGVDRRREHIAENQPDHERRRERDPKKEAEGERSVREQPCRIRDRAHLDRPHGGRQQTCREQRDQAACDVERRGARPSPGRNATRDDEDHHRRRDAERFQASGISPPEDLHRHDARERPQKQHDVRGVRDPEDLHGRQSRFAEESYIPLRRKA
jgi:hypothetical protein